MTPDSPQDPQKGKAGEGAVPEDAKETKAAAKPKRAPAKKKADTAGTQPEAKPKPARAKKADAEPAEVAAAETGIDKLAAEATGGEGGAAAGGETKPKRSRAKRPDERNPEGTVPEGAKEPRAVAATDKATQEAAAAAPAKRDRRRRPEPGVLVRAQAKYVRTSARKARLVCDHIRGKDVAEARAILAFTPRAAAKAWIKLLESAVANAEHNHELVGEDLRIVAVHADEGPTLKRYRPRAMGRATRIRKRTSHLTITLTPKES
jgi:ribosomal protein L22